MDTRIALVGIIVENMEVTGKLNAILHEYHPYIVGRMGIPYHSKDVCVISSLAGRLGMLDGISVKTVYSKTGK